MDKIRAGWLEKQYRLGMELANASDFVDLVPVAGDPPERYIAKFSCTGLIRSGNDVVEANDFGISIWFPSDYAWRANTFQVLSWLGPDEVVHPNIGRGPFREIGPLWICIGEMYPGMSLVDILIQTADVITFRNVTMDEKNALSPESCLWARSNLHRFPTDTRPLRRRAAAFDVDAIEETTLVTGV